MEPSRMPRYDISNDGMGPYAVFYCDRDERQYRSPRASCGAAMAPGAKFCAECGTPAAQPRACASCGKQLQAGAKFCPDCGTPAA